MSLFLCASLPPNITMVVTEAAKKKKRTYQSKAKKSNVRASMLTEFQAAIAYACYDSPSLLCGATSMTDAQQYNVIADLFLGNSETNPDSLCFVDQFLHGLNKFHGLFTTSMVTMKLRVLHLFLRRMTESSAKPWNIWIPSHLKRHDRSIRCCLVLAFEMRFHL